MVLTVVFGTALMCGVLAWRGQLRPEAYAIVLVTMVLAAWAAWGSSGWRGVATPRRLRADE